MCLVVDKATITSVTEAQPTPYVLAIDVGYIEGDDESNEEGYEGHFKVAISSLLPDLYPPLMNSMAPTELWPFANPIFKDAYGIDE